MVTLVDVRDIVVCREYHQMCPCGVCLSDEGLTLVCVVLVVQQKYAKHRLRGQCSEYLNILIETKPHKMVYFVVFC